MSDQQIEVTNEQPDEIEESPWGEVEVEFVKTKHKVRIDMSKLTWGDTLMMQKKQKLVEEGAITDDEATEFLNKIIKKVTGEDANELPANVVQKVMEAFNPQAKGKKAPN